MFTNLLVPLDGSQLAERALPYAAQLAGSSGKLTLIRASDDDVSEAEDYLAAMAARVQTEGASIEWHVYCGPPAEGIIEEAGLYHADAVVMSTHGRSGVQRLIFGSVAEQVLHMSPLPVVLIPACSHTVWPLDNARVIVPLDGSEFAEAATEAAAALAGRLGAKLLLLGVVEHVILGYVGFEKSLLVGRREAEDEALEALSRVERRMRSRGIEAAIELKRGHPVAATVEAAAQIPTAAIVMATHGRTGLDRMIMGSVASGLVRHATVPLVMVRPTAFARATEKVRKPGKVAAFQLSRGF